MKNSITPVSREEKPGQILVEQCNGRKEERRNKALFVITE